LAFKIQAKKDQQSPKLNPEVASSHKDSQIDEKNLVSDKKLENNKEPLSLVIETDLPKY